MVSIDKKYNSKKNKNILDSFRHAYQGIIYALVKERNMHVHVVVASLVLINGALFEISYIEWLVCLVLIALVISLELINTAIEAVVDLITSDNLYLAKVIKDTSAGAVLVMAIFAAFIGVIIFLPKIFNFIINI